MFGERITSPNSPPKGVMIYDTTFRKTDVTDGLGKTVLISEDSINPTFGGEWINAHNVFDQAFAIGKAPVYENDMRSQHFGGVGITSGGVNALFADGTVKFLDQSIDLKVLAAICTRAGGEWFDFSVID